MTSPTTSSTLPSSAQSKDTLREQKTSTVKPSRVSLHGDYLMLGNERYLKSDWTEALGQAFGGSFNPGSAPPTKHNLANPAPLGLCAFALSTFVLSLINIGVRGVKIPNIVVGLAFFYGGLAQLIAGMFEIAVGNTFGGVALSSYAGFWGTWGAIQVKAFGIASAYPTKTEMNNAIGIMLTGWLIFTFMLTLMTVKSTWLFFLMFLCLTITFLFLVIADFTGSVSFKQAGGSFGLVTAFIAWFNAYAGIANNENSYLVAKTIKLPQTNWALGSV